MNPPDFALNCLNPMQASPMNSLSPSGPLMGIKIIEMGQLIAGPFAAKTLGDFGAEVIKIEPPSKSAQINAPASPGGDPLRQWRMIKDGTSVWWQVQSRNKKSIALDLKDPEAQELARRLITHADILIENFRPGAMEGWGLGPEELLRLNPKLIMLRISGYGQSGPYRDKPGFGVVAEAMGGLRHLSAEPGRVPVRVGISIGDTLASLHGVIGILMALFERQKSGRGQVVDVALYEAVFNCMESLLPEFSAFGAIREPAGSELPGIAPSNAYLCADQAYALIAGNGDSIFKRLMTTIGRLDLAQDPELAHNEGRVKASKRIDTAIGEWTIKQSCKEVLEALDKAAVPAGRIYTVKDIAQDPHYRAREMILQQKMEDGTELEVPGIVPKLSRTPGSARTPAPKLGEHTLEILTQIGLSAHQIEELAQRGIIGTPNSSSAPLGS
jgi:formyl-CoA transferase